MGGHGRRAGVGRALGVGAILGVGVGVGPAVKKLIGRALELPPLSNVNTSRLQVG